MIAGANAGGRLVELHPALPFAIAALSQPRDRPGRLRPLPTPPRPGPGPSRPGLAVTGAPAIRRSALTDPAPRDPAGWTYSYEKMPLEESVAHMASVGFDGVELATGEAYSTPIETLDERRVDEVKAAARAPPARAGRGLGAVAAGAAEPSRVGALEWPKWRRSIEVAARLGAPFVAAAARARPPGRLAARAALDRPCGERAAGRRVRRRARRRRRDRAALGRGGRAARRRARADAAVGLPSLRINLDVCHPFALGYDLESIAAMLGPRAVYAHVCDVRGRHPGGPPPAGTSSSTRARARSTGRAGSAAARARATSAGSRPRSR